MSWWMWLLLVGLVLAGIGIGYVTGWVRCWRAKEVEIDQLHVNYEDRWDAEFRKAVAEVVAQLVLPIDMDKVCAAGDAAYVAARERQQRRIEALPAGAARHAPETILLEAAPPLAAEMPGEFTQEFERIAEQLREAAEVAT